MEETNTDLLVDDFWAMIFNLVDPRGDWDSLSLVSKRFKSIIDSSRVSLFVFSPSTTVLSRLLQRFSCLKKIKLVDFPGDLNDAFRVIARSGLDLRELDFSHDKSLSNVCLEDLASNMKNLKVLKCSSSSLVDDDLIRIAELFPGLECLKISNTQDGESIIGVTDEGIRSISTKLERLRKIGLSWNLGISDESLDFLSSNCSFLEQIKVNYCRGVTEKGISSILQNAHRLNSLDVSAYVMFQLSGVIVSASFPKNMHSLSFSSIGISDEFLYSIAKASIPLRDFSLYSCEGFTFEGLSSLVQSYDLSLKCLNLKGAKFLTNENIEHLSRFLPYLTSIRLCDCPELSDSALITLTQRCPHLRDVGMGGTSIGREKYKYDVHSIKSSITSLSLRSTHFLSSSGLKRLLNICPSIEILGLENCFQEQESLDIADILQCTKGIKLLGLIECRQLKFSKIDAQSSVLQQLGVMDSGLDDEVLRMIGKYCSSLVELHLTDCDRVTEEGVKEVVRSCTKLRCLNLSGCSSVNSDITACIVSNRPSLRRLIIPDHLYPAEEHQRCFLQGGCLVYKHL